MATVVIFLRQGEIGEGGVLLETWCNDDRGGEGGYLGLERRRKWRKREKRQWFSNFENEIHDEEQSDVEKKDIVAICVS